MKTMKIKKLIIKITIKKYNKNDKTDKKNTVMYLSLLEHKATWSIYLTTLPPPS